jgi:predicted nucleic acid-binding Zn ribbon protein
MTQPQADFDKDEPLSPEAEAVMAKARRRAAISMLVMLIGFMAIVLVVVYRLVTMGSDVSERYGLQSIALPAGAQVIAAQAQDGLLTVTYATDDTQAIRIFDGTTGEMVQEIAIIAE